MRDAAAPGVAPRPDLAPDERRRVRWALLLWVLFAVVVVAFTVGRSPRRQSVVTLYREASRAWVEGRPLYTEGRQHGFLYLPSFAVLHAPFAVLPFRLGGALWRVANLALLGLGAWRLSRALGGERAGTVFLLASLFTVGWSAARHGQATIAMAGAMLAAAGALAERRTGEAALWSALGLAIKPLGIVLVLLAAVVWRGFALRAAAAAAAVVLLPFLAGSPAYAAEQWSGFATMLSTADDPVSPERFHDLLAILDLGLSGPVAWGVRAVAGLLALLALRAVRRRADLRVTALFLYALSAAYLLWFNPRTEHNTFALVVPALGAAFAWAVVEGRRALAAWHALLAVWFWVDHDVGTHVLGDQLRWSKPALLAAALAGLVVHASRAGWSMRAVGAPGAAPPPFRPPDGTRTRRGPG